MEMNPSLSAWGEITGQNKQCWEPLGPVGRERALQTELCSCGSPFALALTEDMEEFTFVLTKELMSPLISLIDPLVLQRRPRRSITEPSSREFFTAGQY